MPLSNDNIENLIRILTVTPPTEIAGLELDFSSYSTLWSSSPEIFGDPRSELPKIVRLQQGGTNLQTATAKCAKSAKYLQIPVQAGPGFILEMGHDVAALNSTTMYNTIQSATTHHDKVPAIIAEQRYPTHWNRGAVYNAQSASASGNINESSIGASLTSSRSLYNTGQADLLLQTAADQRLGHTSEPSPSIAQPSCTQNTEYQNEDTTGGYCDRYKEQTDGALPCRKRKACTEPDSTIPVQISDPLSWDQDLPDAAFAQAAYSHQSPGTMSGIEQDISHGYNSGLSLSVYELDTVGAINNSADTTLACGEENCNGRNYLTLNWEHDLEQIPLDWDQDLYQH
ncbi:hypothetical protein BOTCAL_0113g00240 [Botryotinia calthae]|uniref:Uncharacterized protein n=1 Tax=Botryotinia calthae TaxID=38488 RepID=A0A4Y8D7A8_9HELO|nr:hypothetical protein BOTCAL_0113g00240 [Botryotinia calthae]